MVDAGRAALVALAPLDPLADEAGVDPGRWLTEDESSRLQAMSAPARRRSFLAGHWLARKLAADWLRLEPARIALHRHPDGRPGLLVDHAPSPLSLSLSHGGGWLACAVASVPVGIDVELPRRPRDLDAIARFAFSPPEAERLQRLPEGERSAAFHLLWTLKEARGKRLGEGLQPERARRFAAWACRAEVADAVGWRLHDGAVALAVEAGTTLTVLGGEALGPPGYWRFADAGHATEADAG